MVKLINTRPTYITKGYKQEFGVDYKEDFAPIAMHDTIRLVIALAIQNS